jgi:hypothetical protein
MNEQLDEYVSFEFVSIYMPPPEPSSALFPEKTQFSE